jgi:hypothetical protein
MTIERLNEILEDDSLKKDVDDAVFEGLVILRKYNPYVIQGAEHDEIYSLDVEEGCEFLDKITEEDAIRLSELGWFIDSENDCLAHYV